MQLNCIHCGRPFTITTEQLGGKGRCPHCNNEVRLPDAVDGRDNQRTVVEPSHWWENSISGLVSGVVHMLLLLFLALYTSGKGSGAGLGDDVLIGELSSEALGPGQDDELSSEPPSATHSTTMSEDSLEVGPPVQVSTTSDALAVEQLALTSPSTGGGSTGSFDLGAVSIGGAGSMGGGSFQGLVQNLRRTGLAADSRCDREALGVARQFWAPGSSIWLERRFRRCRPGSKGTARPGTETKLG